MISLRLRRHEHFHMRYETKVPWTLNDDIVDWLVEQNIEFEHIPHRYEEDGQTYIQQLITFENDRDAMLFKLAWY